jgi:hypothetical protein
MVNTTWRSYLRISAYHLKNNLYRKIIMEKIFISNEIRLEILKICGLPANKPYNLPGQTILGYLQHDDDEKLCRLVEERLQAIACSYKTGKTIIKGDVTTNCSVDHCIKLVLA